MRALAALFIASAIAASAPAQEPADSSASALRPDSLRGAAEILFDKLLTTYRWNGRLVYAGVTGPLSLSLNERFTSTLIRIDRTLVTDEQHVNLGLKYRLSGRLRGASELSSFFLSDDKGIGISNASSHALYGGVEYAPLDNVIIEPLIGMRTDNQIDQHDRGVSYLLRASADDIDYYGYRTRFRGRLQVDRLDPRTVESDSALVSVEKSFFEQTRNVMRFRFTRNRRDFYFTPDSAVRREYGVTQNFETRAENNFAVGDSLDYALSDGALLSFQGSVLTRHIGRETRYRTAADNRLATDIDELRMEGSVQASVAGGSWFNGTVRFLYQERDERHTAVEDARYDGTKNIDALTRLEEEKNNRSRSTSLSTALSAVLSRSDTLGLTASGTLLRYDTPSDANLDDRDELWYILNFTAAHRFNRYLHLSLSADANLTHIVYIASARSADNTWNRIFRLSPRAEYSPSEHVRTVNRFEVLANYTVYDFEYLSSSTRSFAFRQFAFVDSTKWQVSKRFSADWYNYLRFYERGDFRWDDFAERPVNAFEDKTFHGSVSYNLHEGLLFSIGIRYFSQHRFGYIGSERVLERFFRSVGPTAMVRWWTNGGRTVFSVGGWLEHQSMTGQADARSANMTMSLFVRI